MSDKGIKAKRKENFSEWYLEVVRKGGFVDQRTPVKGFDVYTPWGYGLWERLKNNLDKYFKEAGVSNCYFPLLIPHSLLEKESEHFEGFEAETADVTEVGGKKLNEKLAIRPTSETIMYKMMSKWIRSYKDLPMKLNQWNNVVRWDTKMTKPLIRGREFLWSELHTAHKNKEDALEFLEKEIEIIEKLHKDMALAYMIMKRPEHDKFPGGVFSLAFDTLAQDGKVFQGPGGHFLGQNFSKAFNIKFEDEDQKEKPVYQTCLGTSARELGGVIMNHGDDQGAVLPPKISPTQVVVIPIIFEDTKEEVLQKSNKVKEQLEKENVRVEIDDSDESAGYKFNQWEMKGVPLRIEIGPKDIENEKMVAVKRNDGNRQDLDLGDTKAVKQLLEKIQKEMYKKSKKMLDEAIKDCKNMDELKVAVKKGIGRINWCGKEECADWIKDKTGGGEIRGTLYGKDEKPFGECVYCDKKANQVVYVAKSY